MSYAVHTTASAPEESKLQLAASQQAYGFIPNLHGVMAEAPALLNGYAAFSKIFEETSFTPAERQVVLLATSCANECGYCMAAHSAVATMRKVPLDVIAAIRNGSPINDEKLEALRRLTASVVVTRGWPLIADIEAFLRAGYAKAQVLEVVLGVGLKTLSNYANHIANTPLDAAFESFAWKQASE